MCGLKEEGWVNCEVWLLTHSHTEHVCLLVRNCGLCGPHSNGFLQLCPEDDSEHGETDGSSQSQVRVEQHGEDEGDHPDHL